MSRDRKRNTEHRHVISIFGRKRNGIYRYELGYAILQTLPENTCTGQFVVLWPPPNCALRVVTPAVTCSRLSASPYCNNPRSEKSPEVSECHQFAGCKQLWNCFDACYFMNALHFIVSLLFYILYC